MQCPKDAVPTHVQQRATASESLTPTPSTSLSCRCCTKPGLSPSLPLPCSPNSLSLRTVVDTTPMASPARQKRFLEDLMNCPRLHLQIPTLSPLLLLRLHSVNMSLFVSGDINGEMYFTLSAVLAKAQEISAAAGNTIHQLVVKDN